MPEKPNYPDCWIFNINRRVYADRPNGIPSGAPIWREHWEKVKIVGETKRSWLTSCHRKVPKAGGSGYAFSLETIERAAYVETHKRTIARAVQDCEDYDILRQVAELVGYDG